MLKTYNQDWIAIHTLGTNGLESASNDTCCSSSLSLYKFRVVALVDCNICWLCSSFHKNEVHYINNKTENEGFPASYLLGYFFERMVIY